MRFARLIAAAIVVVAVAAGGLFTFAPEIAGQTRTMVLGAPGQQVEVFSGGGSQIGVAVRDADQADVAREKLPSLSGAVIEEVRADSPSAKAGLKSGDVIVSFDGERVRSARQLERLVEETPGGRTVKVAVQRAGARVELDVTPTSRMAAGEWFSPEPKTRTFKFRGPDMPAFEGDLMPKIERGLRAREFDWDEFPGVVPGRARLGVQVQDLSDQLASYFGVKAGVVVGSVDEGSAAAKAGLKAGDVITAVNGRSVEGAGDLRREVAEADEGQAVELSVTREKKPMTLKVEIEPRKTERRIRRTI